METMKKEQFESFKRTSNLEFKVTGTFNNDLLKGTAYKSTTPSPTFGFIEVWVPN